jgi:general secretion pathway protein B
MSIIFDALKRADAQRTKGQVPRLAGALSAPSARSNMRIWALASLFVALGLSTWWFVGSPTEAVTPPEGLVRASTISDKVDAPASKPIPAQTQPQADLSLTDAPGVMPAAVVATDLSKAQLSTTTGASRLSVPSLDSPLTGAAQFNKRPEPVVVAAPTFVATPIASVEPAPVSSNAMPTPVNTKPAEAQVIVAVPAEMVPETASEAGSPPALPSIYELEYQLRHDLPKMAVSMYVYNAQQQYRFVIIGGKRYAEGEQIESKVTVAKIRADGIECEFQGTRFFYPRQTL